MSLHSDNITFPTILFWLTCCVCTMHVQVNFDIIIEEDVVKVNGKMTELDVLTKYELDAEISK